MTLRDKSAVVTGAARGIGLAVCRRLVREGCRVTLWDLDPKALETARAELAGMGGKVFAHACDVTDKALVYRLAETAQKEMGRVDILVNNAGALFNGDFLDQSDEKWERLVAVNLTSLFYTIRAFLPGMHARGSGHVVNVSSAAGTLGVAGLAVYAATKWAVWGLTESLRHESLNAGKRGMRWSSIHPNYIAEGMFEGARIRGLGGLLVPVLRDHDVVAKAVVEGALKKGRRSPKRPRTVKLASLLRGIFPDFIFTGIVRFLGIHESMKTWTGRKS
jgi:NAD(P)-dependent dehydrogenase (short-subunit alcohol dehydrogenase family)